MPDSCWLFIDSLAPPPPTLTATFNLTYLLLFSILPRMKISLSQHQLRFTGPGGSLAVLEDDEVCRRLAMLIEGECEELGPSQAAEKYGFTRQRYYQILADFYDQGAEGLRLQTPGPRSDYRRTDQVVRLVIRCRFLDPESSPEVIAQKIRQQDLRISQRSVERIIADFGLQKKTLRTQSR
jgi:transposase